VDHVIVTAEQEARAVATVQVTLNAEATATERNGINWNINS